MLFDKPSESDLTSLQAVQQGYTLRVQTTHRVRLRDKLQQELYLLKEAPRDRPQVPCIDALKQVFSHFYDRLTLAGDRPVLPSDTISVQSYRCQVLSTLLDDAEAKAKGKLREAAFPASEERDVLEEASSQLAKLREEERKLLEADVSGESANDAKIAELAGKLRQLEKSRRELFAMGMSPPVRFFMETVLSENGQGLQAWRAPRLAPLMAQRRELLETRLQLHQEMRGHIQALEDCKRKIESRGEYSVTAGYFAVAPDHYVRRKVKQMEPWMTAAARTELCKAVAKDRGWLISAAEFEGWKRCGKAMVANHHSPDTEVFGVRSEAKQGGITTKGDGETGDLSSTSIRAELAKHGSTPATIDDLVTRGLLGKEVGECLKRYCMTSSASTAAARQGEDKPQEKGYHSDAYADAQYRQIRAIYDERRIIVYQAYNDAIADAAVKGNSKDKNQARVLALHLSREGFEDLLMDAHLSHSSVDQSKCRDSSVVVQWDPEREMDTEGAGKQVYTRPLRNVRSIQIGLRGTAVQKLLDPTLAGNAEEASAALWPSQRESLLPVSPQLMSVLGMYEQQAEDM
eukprot:s401_g9.t4